MDIMKILENKCLWLCLLLILCFGSANGFDYDISVPEEVEIGEWYSVNVSLMSEKGMDLSVYSYIYRGSDNVGQGWIANKQELSLLPEEQVNITLDDLVKYGTEEGRYNLRVRFRFGEDNITETFNVKVMDHSEQFPLKETYLYIILVLVCIVGVFLAFKFNR